MNRFDVVPRVRFGGPDNRFAGVFHIGLQMLDCISCSAKPALDLKIEQKSAENLCACTFVMQGPPVERPSMFRARAPTNMGTRLKRRTQKGKRM